MTTTYRIAEVAQRSGFSAATLRYYEDIGLVHPAGRTDSGYRLYDDESLRRLRFVARAKQLGCSLDEISELSRAWDGGRCERIQDRLRATIDAKASDAQRQIVDLIALNAELRRAAAGLRVSPTGACDDTCGCTSDPTALPRLTRKPPVAGADATRACTDTCGGTEATDEAPVIACSLDADAVGGRVDEWATLLAPSDDGRRGVVARSTVDGGVRLEFGPDTEAVEIARLAAAEWDCCRFFRFDLSIAADGVALEVQAPADALDVVTALFGPPA